MYAPRPRAGDAPGSKRAAGASGETLSTIYDCVLNRRGASGVRSDIDECSSVSAMTTVDSSYALPNDPEALAGLLDCLQQEFPGISIPPELATDRGHMRMPRRPAASPVFQAGPGAGRSHAVQSARYPTPPSKSISPARRTPGAASNGRAFDAVPPAGGQSPGVWDPTYHYAAPELNFDSCKTAQPTEVTEKNLRMWQETAGVTAPSARKVRLESSVDLNSPRPASPDDSAAHVAAAGVHALQNMASVLQDHISRTLDYNRPVPPQHQHHHHHQQPYHPSHAGSAPASPLKQLGAASAGAAPAAVGGAGADSFILSPRHHFYDQLGRRLTELLLEAGTPLPRFRMNANNRPRGNVADSIVQTDAEDGGRRGPHPAGTAAEPSEADENGDRTHMLTRAKAAAEMFLADYQAHRKALAAVERKLNVSENENLALRSQLDLSMVKMMAAQKEVDKYAGYFEAARKDAPDSTSEESQVRALLKKMQALSAELQAAREQSERTHREEQGRIQAAVSDALRDKEQDLARLKCQLREKKKVIKDMKLMLHSYLMNNDPNETHPRMAFLEHMPATNRENATVGFGSAL